MTGLAAAPVAADAAELDDAANGPSADRETAPEAAHTGASAADVDLRQPAEGEAAARDATERNATHGHATEGNATESNATESNATESNPRASGATAGNAREKEADARDDADEALDDDADWGAPFDVTDPDDLDHVASNDQWAFEMADRMVARLPATEGRGDRRTEGEVFDHSTLMVLHRMLRQGVLRSLDFPVSTGKEANVFRATTPQGGFVAVKIFRVNTATFKHVLKYIQGDERFEGVAGDKRTLVHAWTQKEFRNLNRIRDKGVLVPAAHNVLQNVLIMDYLGDDDAAWPQLRKLGRLEDPQYWFDIIWRDYKAMYQKAGLVHADLSEYNVLVEPDDEGVPTTPHIIDVGQAVLRTHPMAEEFLLRDLKNLVSYFKRQRLRLDEMALRRELDDNLPPEIPGRGAA